LWGFELFLLGFQEFSSEKGMLEHLNYMCQDKVVVVVQITSFFPSVRKLGFPVYDGRVLLSCRGM
jgi:hypothetical protein